MARIIATEEWWLTDTDERVPAGDSRGRYLLVARGVEIEEKLLNSIPEAKAIKGPPEDKALKAEVRKK
jgi:hypothetical protein